MSFESLINNYPLVMVLIGIYVACMAVSAAAVVLRKENLSRIGIALLAVAFVLNTWIIASRWMEAGRPPFKTMYETLVFYPWCVALVTLALVYIHRLKVLIPFASAMSVIGLAYALYRPDVEIINLPPALQSGWFVPHVVTYFVAYAGLFASFVLAAMSLAEHHWKRTRFAGMEKASSNGSRVAQEAGPEASGLERYAHHAAVFGIAALTLGLVMGAVWGKFAWGDYWGWDPKENWALISWLSYMIYLHLKLSGRYRERQAMWVLVIAFGAVVFTYLGMNMLPTAQDSLHVYQ